MDNQNNNRSAGALWNKIAKSGKQYMSGKIEIEGKVIYLAVFPNTRKTQDKHPDYQIVLSERTADGSPAQTYQRPTTTQNYTQSANSSRPHVDNTANEVQVEDIPF